MKIPILDKDTISKFTVSVLPKLTEREVARIRKRRPEPRQLKHPELAPYLHARDRKGYVRELMRIRRELESMQFLPGQTRIQKEKEKNQTR